MLGKAILVDGKVVPTADLIEWARWFETADRCVAFTILNRRRRIRVSTVFLGIDHGFSWPGGPPHRALWFETMIFGTSMDDYQERYPDIASARRGHARAIGYARNARQLPFEDTWRPSRRKRELKKMRKLMAKIERRRRAA